MQLEDSWKNLGDKLSLNRPFWSPCIRQLMICPFSVYYVLHIIHLDQCCTQIGDGPLFVRSTWSNTSLLSQYPPDNLGYALQSKPAESYLISKRAAGRTETNANITKATNRFGVAPLQPPKFRKIRGILRVDTPKQVIPFKLSIISYKVNPRLHPLFDLVCRGFVGRFLREWGK